MTSREQTLAAFFDADERRRDEGVRFGSRWQAEDAPGIFHDLCWAPRTGELYTISFIDDLNSGEDRPVLRSPRMVSVLVTERNLRNVYAKLRGWQSRENEYGSLEWVREQVGRPRPPELFDEDLGDGQRRICRGWYERLLHIEKPGVDIAAGPGGVALCRPQGSGERSEAFFPWQDVVDITAGPWRWPNRHHHLPPPAARHCYLGVEAAEEHHMLLVPGIGPNTLNRRIHEICDPWWQND